MEHDTMRKRGFAALAALTLVLTLLTAHMASPVHALSIAAPVTAQVVPNDTAAQTATQQANDTAAQTATQQANDTAAQTATQQANDTAAQTATQQANDTAAQTATVAAQQTATAAQQTAAPQQTATAAQQTAAPQQTATAAAQQTATAIAAQQTATAAAQQTATAAVQQTATAAAQQTVAAIAAQTATAAARQTAQAAALTFIAGFVSTRETVTAVAQQTAAPQQTATAAAQQTQIVIAAQTAAQQTAQTAAQQTAAAQQTQSVAAQRTATAVAAVQQTAVAQGGASGAQTATVVAAQQQTMVATSGQGNGPTQSQGSGAQTTGNGAVVTTQGGSGQQQYILPSPTPGPSFDTSHLPPPPPAQYVDVAVSGTTAKKATSGPTSTTRDPRRSSAAPNLTATAVAPANTSSTPVGQSRREGNGGTVGASGSHIGAALRVAVLSPLARPGAVQHVVVSYVGDSLVRVRVALPGIDAFFMYGVTDAHGHLTLSVPIPTRVRLLDGRASGSITVAAVSGPWKLLSSLSPTVRPGISEHILVTFAPRTYVRAVVTVPGQVRPLTLYDVTDSHGRLALGFAAPGTAALQAAHNIATIVVSALTSERQAQIIQPLRVSDMTVGIAPGDIVNCVQTNAIDVNYYPATPLKVVLTFPHNYRVPVHIHTDRYGRARVRVRVDYTRAKNPVQISAWAMDARARHHRAEQASVKITLPIGCRG